MAVEMAVLEIVVNLHGGEREGTGDHEVPVVPRIPGAAGHLTCSTPRRNATRSDSTFVDLLKRGLLSPVFLMYKSWPLVAAAVSR